MKAIMISIRPEWVEKIIKGDKTIEIRKTMPKCELPCKVYIYETGGGGKVVAEFTLNKITKHEKNYIDVEDRLCYNFTSEDVRNAGFIPNRVKGWGELKCLLDFDYFVLVYGKGKPLYAWHIEDLKIYDKPKELSEFSVFIPNNECNEDCTKCNAYNKEYDTCLGCMNLCKPLKRPPQSWCYVEEIK